MIGFERAKAIAQAYVDANFHLRNDRYVIAEENTWEMPFGWVFFYDSQRSMEAGDFSNTVLGQAPLIVDGETGEVTETGTEKPIGYYIEKYEQARGKA